MLILHAPIEIESADLGEFGWGPEYGELGWGFRSIGRAFKKVAKATVVNPTKLAVKYTVVAPTKFALKYALALPLKYLKKAVVALGRVLCKAPMVLLQQVASQYGINPDFPPIFCRLVREDRWNLGLIRKYLPTALKLAVKLGASGMFPPIVPVLAVIRHIPYLSRFAGADDNPALQGPMDMVQLYALSDYLGLMDDQDATLLGLTADDRDVMQGVLGEAVRAESEPGGVQVL